jgi:hypothetical protein
VITIRNSTQESVLCFLLAVVLLSPWDSTIPSCCLATRSPVRHSILAPPRRENKTDKTTVATHARRSSILGGRTSSIVGRCISVRSSPTRFNARRTSPVYSGTRASVGVSVSCDAAIRFRIHATRSPNATGSCLEKQPTAVRSAHRSPVRRAPLFRVRASAPARTRTLSY